MKVAKVLTFATSRYRFFLWNRQMETECFEKGNKRLLEISKNSFDRMNRIGNHGSDYNVTGKEYV
jgi:hypothetical protein